MQRSKNSRPTIQRYSLFSHLPSHHTWIPGFVFGTSLTILIILFAAVQVVLVKDVPDLEHDIQKVSERYVIATAYSSTPDQTDDTPCLTADQFNLCQNNLENVIANNDLPFGTLVRFPDHYGERLFVVHDRMNSRYGPERIDLWQRTRKSAQAFGAKRMRMEIVEYAQK